jgi:hypothetical protein
LELGKKSKEDRATLSGYKITTALREVFMEKPFKPLSMKLV